MIKALYLAAEPGLARPYNENKIGYNRMTAASNNNKSIGPCILEVGIEE